jgi:hypothetical protein
MTVEAQEVEVEKVVAPYSIGGEVSAITLIQDVRAIRQRMDSIETALRRLGVRLEELTPLPAEVNLPGPTADSLDVLRNALLLDVQTRMRKHEARVNLLMGTILLTVLVGIGGLGWMVHRLG